MLRGVKTPNRSHRCSNSIRKDGVGWGSRIRSSKYLGNRLTIVGRRQVGSGFFKVCISCTAPILSARLAPAALKFTSASTCSTQAQGEEGRVLSVLTNQEKLPNSMFHTWSRSCQSSRRVPRSQAASFAWTAGIQHAPESTQFRPFLKGHFLRFFPKRALPCSTRRRRRPFVPPHWCWMRRGEYPPGRGEKSSIYRVYPQN